MLTLHLWPHTPLTHCSPSMRTLKMSLRMVMVEPRTKTEKKRVLMGSAILHWGCRERGLCEAGGTAHPVWGWESCPVPTGSTGAVQPGHLEVDDGGSQQDAEALQQVTHHMDKGCPDTGAAGQGAGLAGHGALQLLVGPCAVAVASRGLVQDVGHAGRSRESSVPLTGHGGPAGPAWAKGAHGQSHLGLGMVGGVGLESVEEQGRSLVLGLVTGLGRCCLGDQGMWGVEMWAHGLETPSIRGMGKGEEAAPGDTRLMHRDTK